MKILNSTSVARYRSWVRSWIGNSAAAVGFIAAIFALFGWTINNFLSPSITKRIESGEEFWVSLTATECDDDQFLVDGESTQIGALICGALYKVRFQEENTSWLTEGLNRGEKRSCKVRYARRCEEVEQNNKRCIPYEDTPKPSDMRISLWGHLAHFDQNGTVRDENKTMELGKIDFPEENNSSMKDDWCFDRNSTLYFNSNFAKISN
ncbi:MAG: hypothetical protein AAFX08_07535 [Pseudomonadota bacterium]